jgi:putative flippase GtrA
MSTLRFVRIDELWRYMVSGSTAVLVHMLLLFGMVEFMGVHKVFASAVGFTIGSGVNYVLQYSFVFRATCSHFNAVFKYIVVTSAMLGVNSMLFWLLINTFSIWYMPAQAMTISIIFVLNFLLNRSFTFVPDTPLSKDGEGE